MDASGNTGYYTSLAFDAADHPHIGYINLDIYRLKYAYYTGVAWITENFDTGSSSEYPSLALDINGYPHISYYDRTLEDLRYAYKDASGWHYQVVDATNAVGIYTSL